MKTGHILYICGPFGAGKTTLMAASIRQLPQLKYLLTYTTRAPRDGERSGEGEYVFATKTEYQTLREESQLWDHTETVNTYYGNDAACTNQQLLLGQDFIISSPTDVGQLKEMQAHYRGKNATIWIDTPSKPLTNG